MNNRTLTLFGSLAFLVLSACRTGNENTDRGTPEPDAPVYADTEHNSQNSLDWGGIYSGILPCQDCEGIMTVIELGYDLRYKRQRLYIGESDEVITDLGKVNWDPTGSRITLSSDDPDGEPVSYQVGENILFQLDQDGNRISGALADRYQLSKPYFSIAEKYWQLIALDGKPVQTVEGQHTEPYILFHEKDQRFTGSGGCNRFQGGYELPGDGLITMGTVSATLMMCPDMTAEDRFFKVLEQVERYTISNDTLVFYRQPKTEIARFRTVWFR